MSNAAGLHAMSIASGGELALVEQQLGYIDALNFAHCEKENEDLEKQKPDVSEIETKFMISAVIKLSLEDVMRLRDTASFKSLRRELKRARFGKGINLEKLSDSLDQCRDEIIRYSDADPIKKRQIIDRLDRSKYRSTLILSGGAAAVAVPSMIQFLESGLSWRSVIATLVIPLAGHFLPLAAKPNTMAGTISMHDALYRAKDGVYKSSNLQVD